MFKSTLSLAVFLSTTVFAIGADFTATPLQPRSAAAGTKPFTILTAADTGVNVPNVFNDPRMWGNRFRELTLGAVETGLAVADFDRDGRPDIFAISKNGPCSLYRQTEAFKFTDIAAAAGVAIEGPSSNTGATAVDINHDGWPDLYVCRYDAPNLLFVNNGDGDASTGRGVTFTERGKEYGLDVKDASVHAVFADYDRDGFIDCYLVTNILDFSKSPQGRRDILFRNNGDGTFVDVSKTAGIWGLTQGHTALWLDVNHDGWPDLYVANDFETPDRLYLNKGDGDASPGSGVTFTDVIDERLPHVTYFSMGADAGDLNNDGLVDFMITDMRDRNHAEFMTGMEEIGRGLWESERVTDLIPQYMWNSVYLNTGTDRFAEIAHLIGMEATGWTWSARLGDLDNDGKLDVFITAGMIRNFIDADLVDKQNVAPTLTARANVWKNAQPRRETTLAYHNLGDLKFADVSTDWNLAQNGVSFGCALADLDGDGDLDLVYANYDAPPTIVRNDTTTGHRTVIKLAGKGTNRDGIGAELHLETDAGTQMRQLFTERGIASSEPPLVHFGLGDSATIKKLTIRWPRGQVQVLENLPVDHLLTIAEPTEFVRNTNISSENTPPETVRNTNKSPAIFNTPARADALFAETAVSSGLKHANKLRPFDEFTRQRLLPRRLNGLGPVLATADVNGDKLTDLFVTGTAGQSGELFLAQKDGTFAPAPEQPWSAAAEADDVGATFLDVNGDGHPDLYISAGGIQKNQGDPLLNDRLYLNDGSGKYSLAPEGTLPADGESTVATAAADFDGDGKTDLFVGGRVVPGKYPGTPRSFLYRNVGGKLTDVTDEVAPGLRAIGMVTAAAWADLDNDKHLDLVVATEWGPVSVFKNNGKTLVKTEVSAQTGWWSALTVADVDGDGRLDLIAGNVGLNTKYHASAAEPTVLYSGDLDGNGRTQLIEAQFESGQLLPLRGRSKLAYAFPWLPKKFPTYKAFAAATLTDIFAPEKLAAATKLSATELSSGIFLQQNDGSFKFASLPRAAQIAPINVILARDFDGDGKLDLFCAGNNFGPEANTGRFDGGLSVLLKGDGQGNFTALSTAHSGLLIPGDTRSAAAIEINGKPAIAVSRCDGPLLLFTPR